MVVNQLDVNAEILKKNPCSQKRTKLW